MKNGKLIFVIIGVAVVASIVFVVWRKSAREQLILANPPIEKLLFVKKTNGEFAPEQRQTIREFKAKILARAALGVKFTEKEKEIFNVFISDSASVFPNGEMVVNQSVLKFSAEEINLIFNALGK